MDSLVVKEMIMVARTLSEGTDNTEYVRGQAELIANFIDNDGDVEVYHGAIALITRLITNREEVSND